MNINNKRELIKVSVRVDKDQLQEAKKLLGLSDVSKVIRACMNCTINVTQGLYGCELANIFKRRKTNEELPLYDQHI